MSTEDIIEPGVVWEPLEFTEFNAEDMRNRACEFREEITRRRTVREFSDKPVDRQVIEDCLIAAGSAPSGANLQPWHFAVVTDPDIKRQIRLAAETEEREFYAGRAPGEWLKALAPLGTDADKSFLEKAPVLIGIFAERHGHLPDGSRVKHYYVPESVGIASGFLIAALHHAGLATLTHTPSPMGFMSKIMGRPDNEKPYILLVAGYPSPDCKIPRAARNKKPLPAFTSWL